MSRDSFKTIGILGATLDTPNLGVGALALGAIHCVLHAFPDARVLFLDYGKRGTTHVIRTSTRTVSVPLVNLRFSKKFWLPNSIVVLLLWALVMKLLPFARIRRRALKNPWLRQIATADMFGAVSGGDSFSDIYGVVRFLYVALPQILVILLGKQLILLPQTYGPFRARLPRVLARWIVARSEHAWCRDRHSLSALGPMPARRRNAGNFCYDLAFAFPPTAPAETIVENLNLAHSRDKVLVGVNISGLLHQNGYTGRNEFGLRSAYAALMETLIHHLLAQPDISVLLVPHVLGAGSRSESDAAACEKTFAALHRLYPGRLGLLRGAYSPNEIRHVIGHCSLFVGSRMHACIAALSQHIPTVAIAYSDKFLGVMNTIGAGAEVADARALSPEEILGCVDRALRERQTRTLKLQQRMQPVKEAVLNLLTSQVAQEATATEFMAAR